MAGETTSTSQAALTATEIISREAIKAHQPKLVVSRQLHWGGKMLDAGSGTRRYPVESDLGSASGGTEGTAISTNTEIGMGSSVTVAPTEGALMMFVISDKAVKERLGGMPFPTVLEVFQNCSPQQLYTLLAPDLRRAFRMVWNKIETDCIALIDDAANVVGGGAGVDCRVSDLFDAIYQMRIQQPLRPPSEWKFILTPYQINEVNKDAAITNGGIGGAIWNMQANYGILNRPGDEFHFSGRTGTFLNYPVYEYDYELRLEASSAGKGCLWAGGTFETDPDELGGEPGYGVLEWEQMPSARFQHDITLRSMRVVVNAQYLAKELVDLNGVEISTDDA